MRNRTRYRGPGRPAGLQPVPRPVPVSGRHGFTLLEVLIATALTVGLMAAVFGAIRMHHQRTSVGRLEIERGQIARAVLQRIAIDIRSVMFRPEPAAEEDAEGGDELSEDLPAELADPDEAFYQDSVGVIGNADKLVLHVSKPLPTRAFRNDEEDLFHSDLVSVAWFIAGGAGGGSLESLVANRFIDQIEINPGTPRSFDLPVGLARTEGDRLEITLADEQGDYAAIAERAELLAPEIDAIFFRYFDGADWVEEWDSRALGALPLAIEIMIFFAPIPEDLAVVMTGSAPDSFRLVVALPLADPLTAFEE